LPGDGVRFSARILDRLSDGIPAQRLLITDLKGYALD